MINKAGMKASEGYDAEDESIVKNNELPNFKQTSNVFARSKPDLSRNSHMQVCKLKKNKQHLYGRWENVSRFYKLCEGNHPLRNSFMLKSRLLIDTKATAGKMCTVTPNNKSDIWQILFFKSSNVEWPNTKNGNAISLMGISVTTILKF